MNWRFLATPAFLVSMALMVSAGLGMSAAIGRAGIYLSKKPIAPADGRTLSGASIPVKTRNWVRFKNDELENEETLKTLGTENYLTRTYVPRDEADNPTRHITIHVAYYTGLIDTVPHVPETCLVGGGMQVGKNAGEIPLPLDHARWIQEKGEGVPPALRGRIWTIPVVNDLGATVKRVRLPHDPEDMKIRVAEFINGEQRLYAGYFFIANGGVVASAERVRLLAFDLTDDYAYYLKVQFSSASAKSAEELARDAASLLDDILGDLMLCVPDWVEVQAGRYPPDNARAARTPDDGTRESAPALPARDTE